MKKLLLLLLFLNIKFALFCQTPEKIAYQAIIRNSSNGLVINQDVGIQISIIKNTTSGDAEYIESHNIRTNSYGLASLNIGEGASKLGDFSNLNWGSNSYFVKIEIDLQGGENYTLSNTSELLSAPYALYAKTSGSSLPGPKGDKGEKGDTGLQGLKGDKGEKGDTGLQGLKGDKGDKGEKGDTGLQGLKGDKGDKGEKGDTGLQGLKGDKGEKGDTGLQGLKGGKGDKGEKGDTGLQGLKGDKGETGDTGLQGFRGDKGDKGEKGDIGLQGLQGNKGDKGEKGDTGLQGLKGDKGDKGEKGDIGLQGLKGDKGDKGEKGDTGLQGLQGNKGDKGEKGDTGLQGLQGLQGEKGEKGDKGDGANQTLSINETSISITEGNTIDLLPIIKAGETDNSITNEIELPEGGNQGDVLETDGSGNYKWIKVLKSDEDASIKGKLEVDGAATNKQAFNAGSSATIDFTKSNLAYTTSDPTTFTLEGIKDGGTYTLAVQGTASAEASFTATGFTFKSKNNSTTLANTHTLYTFLVMGTTVYFSMITGL